MRLFVCATHTTRKRTAKILGSDIEKYIAVSFVEHSLSLTSLSFTITEQLSNHQKFARKKNYCQTSAVFKIRNSVAVGTQKERRSRRRQRSPIDQPSAFFSFFNQRRSFVRRVNAPPIDE